MTDCSKNPKTRFEVRHYILCYLKRKLDRQETGKIDHGKTKSNLADIADSIGMDVKLIDDYHIVLHENNEVECECNEEGHFIKITANGVAALVEEKWLGLEKKQINDEKGDIAKWKYPKRAFIVSIVALSMSIISILTGVAIAMWLPKQDLKQLKEQITILQKETKEINSILKK